MKKPIYFFYLALCLAVAGCSTESKPIESTAYTEVAKDSVILSFSFMGCNRINWPDQSDTSATNASTANVSALQRIFEDMTALEQKPALFFFLGDLVLAESNTENLDSQLVAWKAQYNDPEFSGIKDSGIEMVAVPGNHEMLYYKKYNNMPDHDEWPLKGATEIWMERMGEYMPADRDHVTGADSLVNRMTFSFARKNVGFIVMNTDTYNAPTKVNPYGLEGMIPTQWILDKIEQYKNDTAIDHIFVLGHKPYYVDGEPQTGHAGLPEGPVLWPKMQEAKVAAMLSAHVHDYQRMQPGDEGTYQVIAGNAGSKGEATFFGYSTIRVWSSGKLELISTGYDIGDPYYKAVPNNPFTVRDSTILTWTKNANPYQKPS